MTLVNTTAVPVTSVLPRDLARWPTCAFDDAKDDLDVVIEPGGQLDAARLLEAIDARLDDPHAWRERQRAMIARFLPDDPLVVSTYATLLDALMRRPLR